MRRLGVIAVSCVGLLVLAYGIWALSIPAQTLIGMPGSRVSIVPRVLLGMPALILLVFGTVLIAKRRTICDRLFDEAPYDISIDAPSLLTAAVAATGVLLVGLSLPPLAQYLSRPFIMSAMSADGFGPAFGPSQRAFMLNGLVLSGAELVLGAVLCWKARSIAGRLLREPEPVAPVDPPTCPHCGAPYDPKDYDGHSAPLCTRCGQPLDLPGA